MNHPPQIKYAGQLYVLAADPQGQDPKQRIKTRIMLTQLRYKMIPLQMSLARSPEAQQRIEARAQKIQERLQKLQQQLLHVGGKKPAGRPAPRGRK